MARRLSLDLSREQVRAIREAAVHHASEAADAGDDAVKQRWEAVIRETNKALAFAERTRTDSTKLR